MTFLLVLWTCYPIVFALAEGTGKISSNKEVCGQSTENLTGPLEAFLRRFWQC